jgi:hypothetical protein
MTVSSRVARVIHEDGVTAQGSRGCVPAVMQHAGGISTVPKALPPDFRRVVNAVLGQDDCTSSGPGCVHVRSRERL